MSEEYDFVAKGKLNLKSDSQIKKKKKKRSKVKELEEMQKQQIELEQAAAQRVKTNSSKSERKLTKAEQAFKQQQEKMRNKRIMERASTTHKERVEKFNEHLDTLTEHFDIPKVSWTK